MSQTSEVENLDKYKSYIQRRRVGFDNSEDDFVAESKPEKSPISNVDEMSFFKDEGFFSRANETNKMSANDFDSYRNQRLQTSSDSFKLEEDKDRGFPSFRFKPYSQQTNNPRRIDTSNYQRRYSTSYGASNRMAIEDNRATLLAIKIIKQTLACFAILGIIVFLQQRADGAQVLEYIKNQVVESHIEANSILTGVENILTQCSKFFGGAP